MRPSKKGNASFSRIFLSIQKHIDKTPLKGAVQSARFKSFDHRFNKLKAFKDFCREHVEIFFYAKHLSNS